MPSKIKALKLLVLMAKKPIPGHTKTRLIPALSETGAAGLYDAFLHDKVDQMRRVHDVERAIAYHPPGSRDYFSELAPDFILIEQMGTNLSERLENVFLYAFSDGYRQVMAIDGDTPHLPIDYLQSGFEALDDGSKDVVIGPCEDGGYYAIGLREPQKSLFNVEMSTPHVIRDTKARAAKAGLTIHLLPEWWDIDELPDLQRLERLMQKRRYHEGRGPIATQKFLTEMTIIDS
jgi:rSAM/selenodomain-associated transferase 1